MAASFERIPHPKLIERLERTVDDVRLIDLIALWLEHHSYNERGLPQGSPLSPLLANLYLDDVDEAIEARGVRLVRFADDFVLLCKSEAAAAGALERMRDLLAEHGLELHPEKTRIVPFDQGFRFLGHLFVRSMVLREIQFEEGVGEDAIPDENTILSAAGKQEATQALEDKAIPRGRWACRQRVLYLLEPGRTLGVQGEAFIVRDGESVLLTVPQSHVDRIETGPGVAVSTAALDLAAASDTLITRVDGHGRTLGIWSAPGTARAKRQLDQASLVLDPERRNTLARVLVAGRIRNQYILLKRLDRKRRDPEIAATAVRLARILRKVEREQHDAASAMGYEGQAAALYWPALVRILGDGTLFSGKRRRRTGEDPFNIVLDVMSSLLARDVLVAITRCGLHPGFGVLHSTDDDEESLVYDLTEEFRAPIAEAAAISLFGRRSVRQEHFVRSANALRLAREGWAACIRGYEAWVARPITSPASGERLLWRGLIAEQVQSFADACFTGARYRPYAMDY